MTNPDTLVKQEVFGSGPDKYVVSIYYDQDALNPLEDVDGMGTIKSFNSRHGNFDREFVDAGLWPPDAVPLSYFEHGNCIWSVLNELPPGANCPWDSVRFAGLWVPDEGTREEAPKRKGKKRLAFMQERACAACDAYTKYCNGEFYGFVVEKETKCEHCGHVTRDAVESCGGFDDFDYCRQEALSALPDHLRPKEGQ